MIEYPPITIVIPAYNAEEYIENCLQSVLLQEYPPSEKEILVVDDGSTDRTAEIVKRYPEVTLYSLPENQGCGHALNYGFRKATGKYIAWIAADDQYSILYPFALCRQVRAMEARGASWSYWRDFYQQDNGTVERIEPYWFFFRLLNPFFEYYNLLRFFMLFLKNPINSSGVMFHHGSYYQFGEWDPLTKNADCDREMWFKYSLKGAPLAVLNGAAIVYRLHEGQLSRQSEAMEAGYRYTKEKAWKLFKERYLARSAH